MLEISDKNFFYLKLSDKHFLFTDYENAIIELKTKIDELGLDDVSEDDIELDKVTIKESGEWEIKETSWFDFALELMKDN